MSKDSASSRLPDPGGPLGRNIKVERARRGLSRAGLAEAAGVSYSYLSEIEKGVKFPSARVLEALAGALGVSVGQLTGSEDDPDGMGFGLESRNRLLEPESGRSARSWAARRGAESREAFERASSEDRERQQREYRESELRSAARESEWVQQIEALSRRIEQRQDTFFRDQRDQIGEATREVTRALEGSGVRGTSFPSTRAALGRSDKPLWRLDARHLRDKRILWIDPHPDGNAPATEQLSAAMGPSGGKRDALVTVATPEEGLVRFAKDAQRAPFDLVITHWGAQTGVDPKGGPVPAAVRLLEGIREGGFLCPVIVFSGMQDADTRKREALGLGAQAYCFAFETLFQTIERILAPGSETG